jgi:hypothetical protein
VKRGGELVKRYAGDWVDGKRHGYGVFFFDNGDKYEGDFERGKRYGRGTMVYSDGAVYEGDWVAGKREGVGVLTSAEGDAYEGHWKNDLKHGPGRLFYRATRKMYEGEWVEGNPKCGVFSSIPGGDKLGDDGDDFVLPSLGLVDPDSVIRGAVAAVRESAPPPTRHSVEDASVPRVAGGGVDDLTDHELEELRFAFTRAPLGVNPADDSIAASDLAGVLEALGLDPSLEDVERIGSLMVSHPSSDRISFRAFADVMARLRE